jgi:hypothetical protein
VEEAFGRPGTSGSILVIGVYLVDRDNNIGHVVGELNESRNWVVEQQWVALGRGAVPDEVARVTAWRANSPAPKFSLLNRLLAKTDLDPHAFVIVCDDDITLPAGFLDRYLELVLRYDFALAQPARTHDSFIDHAFVERLDGLTARWTRFVEIGPLISIRRDAAPVLLPFDQASPMGWGYDFVWPHLTEQAGLKTGIIDAVAVAHNLRRPVAHYDYETARQAMETYLSERPHLSKEAAFHIVESYV